MLLILPYTEYLRRLAEPRNIADIVIVFLVVYAVLKLVRGTRAAPMAADGFWIITFGQCGLFGLGAALAFQLLGPAVLWFRLPPAGWGADRLAPVAVAALVLVLYMIDNLFNAMLNPIYLLVMGGLVSVAMGPVAFPVRTAPRGAAMTAPPLASRAQTR